MSKKVGVIMSGCGVYDGAEIHESVITLLALNRAGAKVTIMAPDKDQMHVINHQTGEVAESETRNIMVESARIARGPVRDISTVEASEFDALVLPGGFGAAKNLCNFAVKGPDCEIDGDVASLILEMHNQDKPILAMCIAPAVAAKALTDGGVNPKVTIGTDKDTAGGIEKLGATHEDQPVEGVAIDSSNKVITTPAYMLGPEIKDIAAGIEKAIDGLMEMI